MISSTAQTDTDKIVSLPNNLNVCSLCTRIIGAKEYESLAIALPNNSRSQILRWRLIIELQTKIFKPEALADQTPKSTQSTDQWREHDDLKQALITEIALQHAQVRKGNQHSQASDQV